MLPGHCSDSPALATEKLMKRILDWLNDLYPVWLVSLAVVSFIPAADDVVVLGRGRHGRLALSMLGMGFHQRGSGLRGVASIPGSVVLGFCAQYTIMPLSGWLVAKGVESRSRGPPSGLFWSPVAREGWLLT